MRASSKLQMLVGGFGKIADDTTAEAVLEQMRSRRPISPDDIAERALPKIAANRAIIVVPAFYRIGWWIYRLRTLLGFGNDHKGLSDAVRRHLSSAHVPSAQVRRAEPAPHPRGTSLSGSAPVP